MAAKSRQFPGIDLDPEDENRLALLPLVAGLPEDEEVIVSGGVLSIDSIVASLERLRREAPLNPDVWQLPVRMLFQLGADALALAVQTWQGGGVDLVRTALAARQEFLDAWQQGTPVRQRHPMMVFIQRGLKCPPDELRRIIAALRTAGKLAIAQGWVIPELACAGVDGNNGNTVYIETLPFRG